MDSRFAFCGEGDGALREVAERLAAREARGAAPPDGEELTFELRSAGSPLVWPHAWLATLNSEPDDGTQAALGRALDKTPQSGPRRCGIATLRGRSSTVIAVVWADALADLAPVPTTSPHARYVSFDARLLVPATRGKLYVLPPEGKPFTVPTTLHSDRVRATVSVDRPGKWTLQLVARVAGGPRPVLETVLFVERQPPSAYQVEPAPGEASWGRFQNPTTQLVEMAQAARASQALPPLARSSLLDAVAERRAAALAAAQTLAHDTGDGDPAARLGESEPDAHLVGENVAHETSVTRAARALWSSVSHRGNLLEPRFRAIGVGVAKGDDGSLWIAEEFTDFSDDVIAATTAAGDRPTNDAARE